MGIASYIIPVLCALILHGGLLLLLIPHWFHQEDPYRKRPQFIQAQMIDFKTLSNQENLQKQFKDEQLKKAEKEKKRVDNEQQRKLEETKKALAEQQDIEKQKAAQQKQETEIKQKVAEEQKRQEAEVQKLIKAKEQKVIENARKIAAEKERKEEDKKKEDAKKKLEADKKRKAEESRKVAAQKEESRKEAAADKKRKEDDAKRKESERKAVEEKKRQQEDARLKAENIANQKAAAAERADKMRGEISGYIQALIEKNWRYPSNTRNGMSAKVLIRLFPSGEVDSVEILESSGDAAFDKSTEQAVLRVGRFTRVSEVDPQFFERELRKVIIEFRPEGLRW